MSNNIGTHNVTFCPIDKKSGMHFNKLIRISVQSQYETVRSRASPGRISAARCGRNSGKRTRRCRSCIKSRELYKRLRGCEENALRSRAAFGLGPFSQRLSSCCPCLFAPIALFSANLRYISIKSPFLTKILTHSLYYGKRAVG